MIIAKTGMSEVPEGCVYCRQYSRLAMGYWFCNICTKRVVNRDERPSWCPLEEIESLEKGGKP